MLCIDIPPAEYFDEADETFVTLKGGTLKLEHSLRSVSKWESKWHKSFLNTDEKSNEEWLDYVRCMTINKVEDQNIYNGLTVENVQKINEYISDPMTATVIHERRGKRRSRKVVTSEVIYSWMVDMGIPFECENWHLARLMTLIRVCDENGTPKKKMSKKDIFAQNAALNAARKKH